MSLSYSNPVTLAPIAAVGRLPAAPTILLQTRRAYAITGKYGSGPTVDVTTLPWGADVIVTKSKDELDAGYTQNNLNLLAQARRELQNAQTARDQAADDLEAATQRLPDVTATLAGYRQTSLQAQAALFTAQTRLDFLTATGADQADLDAATAARDAAQRTLGNAAQMLNTFYDRTYLPALNGLPLAKLALDAAVFDLQDAQRVVDVAQFRHECDVETYANYQAVRDSLGHATAPYQSKVGGNAPTGDPNNGGTLGGLALLAGLYTYSFAQDSNGCTYIDYTSYTTGQAQYRYDVRLTEASKARLETSQKYEAALSWLEVLATLGNTSQTDPAHDPCKPLTYAVSGPVARRDQTPQRIVLEPGDFDQLGGGSWQWFTDAYDLSVTADPSQFAYLYAGLPETLLEIADFQYRGGARTIQGFLPFLQEPSPLPFTTRYHTLTASTDPATAPEGVSYSGALGYVFNEDLADSDKPYEFLSTASDNWGQVVSLFAPDAAPSAPADLGTVHSATELRFSDPPGLVLTLGDPYTTGNLQEDVAARLGKEWGYDRVRDTCSLRFLSRDGTQAAMQDGRYKLARMYNPPPGATYLLEQRTTDLTTLRTSASQEAVQAPTTDPKDRDWMQVPTPGANRQILVAPVPGTIDNPEVFDVGVRFVLEEADDER